MPTQNEQPTAATLEPDPRTLWKVHTASGRLTVRAVDAIDAAAVAVIALHNAGLDTGPRVKVSQHFDLQQILDHMRQRPPATPADRPTLVPTDQTTKALVAFLRRFIKEWDYTYCDPAQHSLGHLYRTAKDLLAATEVRP